jgi:hypothetical protein
LCRAEKKGAQRALLNVGDETIRIIKMINFPHKKGENSYKGDGHANA